jgi:Bacterial Alpha-2-macroglobulin MG10 domain
MRFCLFWWFCTLTALCSPVGAQSSITVTAQLPVFLYQGDQPKLQFLLSNNSATEQTGNLQLELFDAIKKQPVDGWFYNQLANQYFTLGPGERYQVRFPVTIPHTFSGSFDWQLTLRIDSTQQQLRGQLKVINANQHEDSEPENEKKMKGGIVLIGVNQQSSKPASETNITPFSTQPVGQPVLVRFTIVIHEKMDSCRVLLPVSAGLQPTGNDVQLKKAKPRSIVHHPKSDTAISMTLYGLAPGVYQWDYPFIARYPGEFLVPSCRLLLFNATRRDYRTATSSILID